MPNILRSSKTRFTQGRLYYTQGPLFCALVQEGPFLLSLNGAQTRVWHVCAKRNIIRYMVNRNVPLLIGRVKSGYEF